MQSKRNLIEQSVAQALPSGMLQDLNVEPTTCRCDAHGRIALPHGKTLDVCFETGVFPSTASLLDRTRKLQNEPHHDPTLLCILVAPFFSEAKQEFMRDQGINFIDAAGNAWISTPDILIDRSGRKNPSRSPASPQDPFSDKATLIIRLLFSGEAFGVRKMEAVLRDAGFSLSPGYISKTVAALVERRYATKGKNGVRLINRDLLLQDWAEAYQRKERKTRCDGWFFPTNDLPSLVHVIGQKLEESGALTDRAGASLVDDHATFDTIDILPKDASGVSRILSDLGAIPVERGANINVKQPAYPVSSFYDIRRIHDVPVVADLQLYLDLRCQPRRGQEAAEHLFDRLIQPLLTNEE